MPEGTRSSAPGTDEVFEDAVLEEFSIMELEDRFEFDACCNGDCDTNENCDCPQEPELA